MKRKPTKRNSIIIISILFLLGAVAAWWFISSSPTENEDVDSSSPSTSRADENSASQDDGLLRIVATGDMIAHDSVIANAEQADGSYDFYSLMQRMQPFFAQADVGFCNEATPAGGERFGISGYPIFNAPLEWHDGMESVGCNVINLGTNHTYDKGEPLVDAMVADWQDRDVFATAGAYRDQAEREQISYFDAEGVRFAFLSYSTYTNESVPNDYSLVRYDRDVATREIAEAKDSADIVLVSMRWGVEYSDAASSTDQQIARDIADAGADYVFGHGPHVLQPVERINRDDGGETIVWYSLGNFLNTQIPVEALIGGFAVMDIDRDSLELQSVGFLPVYSHYEWSAENAAAENLLARENLQMYALDEVDDSYFASQQLDSTVQAERERVTNVLNRLSEVTILSSDEF